MSFGVTYAEISQRMGGLVFSADSTPTSSAVTTWISESADRVGGILRNLGRDPDSVTSAAFPEGYATIRRFVILDVTADAVRARDRGVSETSDSFRKEADALLSEIKRWPATLGDAQPRGESAPNRIRINSVPAAGLPTAGASYMGTGRGQL
jgi:hypothetical protein